MNSKLKTIMRVISVYFAILGILFAFAPSTARSVFGIQLSDQALTLLYGQVVLALAYMAHLVATNEGLAKMADGFLVLFVGHILVFAYQLATNVQTFAQVGPPLIISAIFSYFLFNNRN
ncbi:MAG: hypothetical protein N2D54_03960 [Chloroflexota bacterium]